MHNANLRGEDLKVRGVKIDDYIRALIRNETKVDTGTTVMSPGPLRTADNSLNEELGKKLSSLKAFEDEKNIMSTTVLEMTKKITKMEELIATVGNDSQVPIATTETRFEAIESRLNGIESNVNSSLTKLEKKISDTKPRRGVDQQTLDSSMQEMKNEFTKQVDTVAEKIAVLRHELEED